MQERLMPLYVTPETDPVAPETVLMRTPFWEFEMEEFSITMELTVLSERPPTEPIEMP
jgi:hypothetical protein